MVSILITTYNSEKFLKACLGSVLQQDYADREIVLVDNDSKDGTRAILKEFESTRAQGFAREGEFESKPAQEFARGGEIESHSAGERGARLRVIYNDTNVGFAAGQNQAIAEARGEWLFSLNPDVTLKPDFLSTLIAAAGQPAAAHDEKRIGAVCGKLLRWKPDAADERSNTIDSTGIYFLRNLRHLDRGSDEIDRGQYERREYVVGATGAAALYRRAMVEDISAGGEFFDEDFFAYREDADVAWRAQLMGWSCLYVPEAVAWHVRRVTPERFRQLPDEINRHSIKNRFLMRAKNISAGLYLRLLVPVTARDLLIFGYCVLFNRGLLSGLGLFWSKREAIREKRRWIQSHRRTGDGELARWFDNEPRSELF